MKWIVVAILLILLPYTFIRLYYAKPNRAFEPYQDMKNQANTLRLLSAGFQRITLDADLPTEPPRPNPSTASADTVHAPAGLPAALAETLVDQPLLPAEIVSVATAPATSAMFAYPIRFTCTLPDQKRQLSGAHLYVRDAEMFIVPVFDKIDGELLARSRESLVRLTVPSGALKPGSYRVTLIGATASKAWQLEVR